jgi:uncharacterized 2Fe-2S/4Fe-4S cluster protein (DUF4445 family)
MAYLRRAGLLDTRGRMAESPLTREAAGVAEFVLAGDRESGSGRAITVTQEDIRELQLAKGAIRTGIETLLQDASIGPGNLDQVIIAGAFGIYIDVQSAIAIGLLPELPAERVSQVGNAAGTGARLALISQTHRQQAQEIARRVRYIELARSPRLMRNFAEAMYF